MQGLPLLTLAGLLAAAVASYASAHAQHSRELLVGSDSDDALEVGRDTKHQANPCPPDLLQEGVIENFTPLVKSKTELGYNPFLPVRCAVKTFSQLRKVVQDSRVDEVIVMQDMEMPEVRYWHAAYPHSAVCTVAGVNKNLRVARPGSGIRNCMEGRS
eukprot:scaffold593_cov382-Prasinococcus_capsulatus_cf.AAC.21